MADVVCVVDGSGIAGVLEVRDLSVRLVSAVRGVNAAHPVTNLTNLIEIKFGMTYRTGRGASVNVNWS